MIFFYILILIKNKFNMTFKPETPTNIWNNLYKLMPNDSNSVHSDLSNVSDNLTLILTDINTEKKNELIDNYINSPKKKRKIIKESILNEMENLNNDIYGDIGLWADEPTVEEEEEIEAKLYSLDLLNKALPNISSDEEEDDELSELFSELEEEIKEKSNFAKKVDKATSFLHRNLIAFSIAGGKRKLEKHISAFIEFVK